jgi:Patatin-like phospholipase
MATKQNAETQQPEKSRLYDDHEVLRFEHVEIGRRRGQPVVDLVNQVEAVKSKSDDVGYAKTGIYDTIGLALSGGGIRSAAFCTGAMQALDMHGVLRKTDYISSVSGGGYAAVAAGMGYIDDGKFPFYADEEQKDTPAMGELRNNAAYLKTQGLDALRNLAVYLRGIAANFVIITPVLLFLAWFTLLVNPSYDAMRMPDFLGLVIGDRFGPFTGTTYIALILLLVYAVWALWTRNMTTAGVEGWASAAGGVVLVLVGFVLFLELHPYLVMQMVEGWRPASVTANADNGKSALVETGSQIVTKLVGFFTAISAFLTLISSSLGNLLKTDSEQNGFIGMIKSFFRSRILWIGAALILPLTFWLVYLLLVYWAIDLTALPVLERPPRPFTATLRKAAEWMAFGSVPLLYLEISAVMFGLWYFLSANGNSPHRLYRDRLGAAFCFPHLANPTAKRPKGRDDTESVKLKVVKKLSQLGGNGPYHLINTALNIAGDPMVNQRGRDADFFLFSQKFIGSKATQYAATDSMEKIEVLGSFDVASAMAVSGAAFSSNMGSATIKLLRLTFAFFNVRLGYWFPNPMRISEEKSKDLKRTFIYFLQEVLGSLTANTWSVYLSDGGHVENLGVYELLRRRCQLIIVIDAEADPKMTFGSYVRAQRYARIDLGAVMHVPWRMIAARSLAAQKGDGKVEIGPHCAIGTIDYDKGGHGHIIYVKSSVTGDEKDYIKDYNARYVEFPHETTADQFFSEEQFEVYRALGYHAVNGLLDGTHIAETSKGLEDLLDPAAQGDGVQSVARLLGLKQRRDSKNAANTAPVEAKAPDPVPLTQATQAPLRPAPAPLGRRQKKRESL